MKEVGRAGETPYIGRCGLRDSTCTESPMTSLESGMGLPPPADEDRQVEPALDHEQSQGGSIRSKLEQSVTEGSIPEDRGCSGSSAATMPMGQSQRFGMSY